MLELLNRLDQLFEKAAPENFGDIFVEASQLVRPGPEQPQRVTKSELARLEVSMARFYEMAAKVDEGWKLFATVDMPTAPLNETHAVQLVTVSAALKDLSFCYASLPKSRHMGPWSQTAIRFYINSICSGAASLFLLDEGKNASKGIRDPGSVAPVLQPLGLDHLLKPIFEVMNKKVADLEVGKAILQIRNQSLVHTTFLPKDIKPIFSKAKMQTQESQISWQTSLNDLGDEMLILQLRLQAVFNASGKDLMLTVRNHMIESLGPEYDPFKDT